MSVTKTNRKQYNKTFRKELARLNPAQRQAVDNIEGPVLVVAGPGTGKTHILTARIGRILLETDALPHNILCLTFTDAGVHAMRERLLEFIGPEAHRVHIYTFHSFCNNIIQENLELFGRNDLEPLGDLERVELMRRILEDLDINHPLKQGRADIYFYENHLYDLFQMMKSEAWSVEYVSEQIDAFLEDLPNRKEFVYQVNRGKNQKGDLKEVQVDDAIQKMEKLRAAAELYPVFNAAMRQARRYDFADMILWVLRAFEENEALLRTYQENYLYFLIDEYQDTNGAQNEIIQHLINYWENPNIFIVGDDDQSIYEFQGARLKNLTDFFDSYREHLNLVVLKENYRSAQTILDASRQLIDENQRRIVNNLQELGIDKVLQAKNRNFATLKQLPTIIEYPNRLHEDVDIVTQIESLQKAKFPLQEIAIIYAKHKQVQNIVALLEKKKIPYNTRRKVNILDLRMMQNLRMLLDYFQAEYMLPYSGESFLFKILHFDFLNIIPQDLAKLSLHIAAINFTEKPKWRDILGDADFLNNLNLKNVKVILQFSELLEFLLASLQNIALPAFIEKLINRSGLLLQILRSEHKVWELQVLNTFVNFVKKETDRNPRLHLGKLLETLKNMDANRLSIEIQKTIVAEEGVNLVTAHSAKGLEFQKVFIIDAVQDSWEPRNRKSSYQFLLPDTLTFSGEEDALEARRRLFYVAMTRAKESLQISYSAKNNEGKDLQKAIFLEEIAVDEAHKKLIDFEQKELVANDLIEAQSILLLETQPHVEAQNKALINALLEGFSLSVSSLNKFLKCPLSFYYENVLNVPIVESEMASYGTAMHNTLQRGFEKMLASEEKIFPSKTMFLQYFEYEMQKKHGNFTAKDYLRRLEMGQQYIGAYYDLFHENWPKNTKLEHRITDAEIKGVPLNGTIDRLDLLPNQKAHILDYKTGSHSSGKIRLPNALSKRKTKSEKLSSEQEFGGIYWRQLVFYKILLANSRYSIFEAKSGEIAYLNPDGKGEFPRKKITYGAEDMAFVEELIVETYRKIKAHEFYEGCGEKTCRWCNFVKGNLVIDSFSDKELEELDD